MNVLEVDVRQKVFHSPEGQGGDVLALSSLQFSVPKSQFTCVLGPSGSGKTTLLQIISGIDANMEGGVLVSGVPPTQGPPLGYMFQAPHLMPWLTVLDNVNLVAGDRARAAGAPRILLEKMGLGGFCDTYPNRLSGGMQRRVALARAFVNEPPLLLLDEPFISLDEPVANRLRDLLLDLWEEHKSTILFVTHDLREALQLGDRILFMSPSPGRVVLDHTVELPRPREPEGVEMGAYRQRLLEEHPSILAGLESQGSSPGGDDREPAYSGAP